MGQWIETDRAVNFDKEPDERGMRSARNADRLRSHQAERRSVRIMVAHGCDPSTGDCPSCGSKRFEVMDGIAPVSCPGTPAWRHEIQDHVAPVSDPPGGWLTPLTATEREKHESAQRARRTLPQRMMTPCQSCSLPFPVSMLTSSMVRLCPPCHNKAQDVRDAIKPLPAPVGNDEVRKRVARMLLDSAVLASKPEVRPKSPQYRKCVSCGLPALGFINEGWKCDPCAMGLPTPAGAKGSAGLGDGVSLPSIVHPPGPCIPDAYTRIGEERGVRPAPSAFTVETERQARDQDRGKTLARALTATRREFGTW